MLYKNRSSSVQTVNTNKGRTLYVGPGEEVALEAGEETSEEIVGKTRGAHPTGALRDENVTKRDTLNQGRARYPGKSKDVPLRTSEHTDVKKEGEGL